jgi:hypothetical protein
MVKTPSKICTAPLSFNVTPVLIFPVRVTLSFIVRLPLRLIIGAVTPLAPVILILPVIPDLPSFRAPSEVTLNMGFAPGIEPRFIITFEFATRVIFWLAETVAVLSSVIGAVKKIIFSPLSGLAAPSVLALFTALISCAPEVTSTALIMLIVACAVAPPLTTTVVFPTALNISSGKEES